MSDFTSSPRKCMRLQVVSGLEVWGFVPAQGTGGWGAGSGVVQVVGSDDSVEALLDVGSPTAWRARIRVRGFQGEPVPVPEGELTRSFEGVRQVFGHCLDAALGVIEAGQMVGGNDLEVGYSTLGTGDYALWFDIRDRRDRLARWLTPKMSWESAVEAILGDASNDVVALLRAVAMGVRGESGDLMIRPVPGPEGMGSRVEISLPGQQAARLGTSLWNWAFDVQGVDTVRDMLALLAAEDVSYVEVILYSGTPREIRVRLDASAELVTFVRGDKGPTCSEA